MTDKVLVDWHSHAWLPHHLGEEWGPELDAKYSHTPSACGSAEQHAQAMVEAGVTHSVVIALVSRHLGLDIPNEYVASYVQSDPEHLIGVASVDPNDRDAPARLKDAAVNLRLRGVKLSPPYQAFHPHSPEAFAVYRTAADLGLAVIFHQGAVTHRRGVLEHASPILLDRVAREFPELRVVIAHMGQPWFFETIPLLRKHANVYADISARCSRPAQLAAILHAVMDYGVTEKLLFGSDFPTFDIAEHIEGLRSITESARGDRRGIPDSVVEDLLYRRPLSLLGFA